MDSEYYQKTIENFIWRAESYMDYYLSYHLLKNNIESYIDSEKFNLIKLRQLEECADDNTNSSENENKISLSDEEMLFNSINLFIIEIKKFYNFNNKSSSLIRKDLFEILMNSITEEKNRCVECGTDMGRCNPRQLCGKLFCLREGF